LLELYLRCAGIDRQRFAPLKVGQAIQVPAWSPARIGKRRCDADAVARLE